MATTYLATKSANPSIRDHEHVQKIFDYLSGTIDLQLWYDSKASLKPVIYADASHGIHRDGKGQGGIIISLGSAPILCKSFKIKMVTRSSTESELIALEEASTFAVWYRMLLKDMKIISDEPTTIYQDNKSSIIIATMGGSFNRTKHLIGRQSYVRERIDSKEVILEYLPTEDMPADLLTKPLPTGKLKHMLKMINMK
jgi:hypothetical protein